MPQFKKENQKKLTLGNTRFLIDYAQKFPHTFVHVHYNKHKIHPKLCNINLHKLTHSLISQCPRERISVVQIALLIVAFSLPYITKFVINANHQRSQPTSSHCTTCQYVECLLLLPLLPLMPLVECWCVHMSHCTRRRSEVDHTTPHHTVKMLHFVLFHSVTCYTNPIVSCIHANTTKLRNITSTLVATCVILQSVKCTMNKTTHIIYGVRYIIYITTEVSKHSANSSS